jgi:hypothetical protein
MASAKHWTLALAERWDREARDLERKANTSKDASATEKRLMEMHGRVRRGCAQELRLEHSKLVNSGR